jgi:hypothetical protein
MATPSYIYLDSVYGSDSYDGTTWAKAKATLQGALNIMTLNYKTGYIFVAAGHTESYASASTVISASSVQSIADRSFFARYLIRADRTSGEPPTSMGSSAASITIANDGTNTGYISLDGFSVVGVTLSAPKIIYGRYYDNCVLTSATPSVSTSAEIGMARQCTIKFLTHSETPFHSSIARYHDFCVFGGSGSITPTYLDNNGRVYTGCDFSAFDGTGLKLMSDNTSTGDGNSASALDSILRNCNIDVNLYETKLTSVTQAPLWQSIRLINCGDTPSSVNGQAFGDAIGYCRQVSTVYRSSGANYNGVGYSCKAAGLNKYSASFNIHVPFRCPPIHFYVSNPSYSTFTATVEILYDGSSGLDNSEVWVELLGKVADADLDPRTRTTYPPNRHVSSRVTTVRPSVSGASAYSTGVGTGSWTKPSPSVGWISQKMTVTFDNQGTKFNTPEYYWAVICLNTTKVVYFCPEVEIAFS